MTPNIYGDGIYRMEHFDVTTGQARPYRALVASDVSHGSIVMKDMIAFCKGAGTLYGIGKDVATGYYAMAVWDSANYRWNGTQSFGAAFTLEEMLFFSNDYLYGLGGGTVLWKMAKTGGVHSTAITVPAHSYYTQAIFHSKEGNWYFGLDNTVCKFNGSAVSVVLTLPTSFVITCVSENGDFLSIAGYDSQSGKGTEYLWDRDSSLETVTQKYDLYQETPYVNATIGGTHFIITISNESTATPFLENVRMNIRYINSDKAQLLNQYLFDYLYLNNVGYYQGDKLYFNGQVKFKNESLYHFVVFELDEKGNLRIVQNVSIADTPLTSYALPAVLKDGDGFWVGGRLLGQWNTTTTYPTLSAQSSFIETVKYSSPDFSKDIDIVGYTVSHEPLPSGASVVIKTRADAETSWTTIATSDTDNAVDYSMNSLGTNTCSERQFRLESLGGAVITGFQVLFKEIPNKVYGN